MKICIFSYFSFIILGLACFFSTILGITNTEASTCPTITPTFSYMSVSPTSEDSLVFHPIHITVFKMEYKPNKKQVQIIINVFIEDLQNVWEQAKTFPFKDYPYKDIDDSKVHDLVIKEMEATLNQQVNLTVNGTPRHEKVLGFEVKDDTLQFYIVMDEVKKIETFEVNSSFLLTLFDSQQNLFFLKYQGEEYSARLKKGDTYRKLL